MGASKQRFIEVRQDEQLRRWEEERRTQLNDWVDEIDRTNPAKQKKKLTLRKKL